jgi:hypothetical protein
VSDSWPDLESPARVDTVATVGRWAQIVGKTRLALEPMLNHWWQVTLAVTGRGLATPVLYAGDRAFDVELDFVDHALVVRSAGKTRGFALEPMAVADFWRRYRDTLGAIGVVPKIWPHPVEVIDATPFPDDVAHRTYDRAWMTAFARALQHVDGALKEFRGRFIGKASPVHFFWGAFDLAVTRFSGRPAPRHPGGAPNCPNWVMEEAYSHEVSSTGFWPGDDRVPPSFYAYAYPEPDGFARSPVAPTAARWDPTLREFLLPYEAVRRARDPRGELRAFLDSTYAAAAELARWDRAALER